MAINPTIITHRNRANKKAALIFIHGFGGSPQETWGQFPELLKKEKQMSGWDIYSLGYPSGFWLDLVGIWKADPPIQTLADGLRTALRNISPLNSYESLALIAHSMGGLVAQQALVDDDKFTARVNDVILFGTPSGGLRKASFFKFWKRQLRGMAKDGPFIKTLRAAWDNKFSEARNFNFWAVAGNQDEFVPRESSIDIFPLEHRCVVQGDHLSIVKPNNRDHQSFQVLMDRLTSKAQQYGPIDAALLSVETRRFYKIVDQFGSKEGLDEDRLVDLALALEGIGRAEDAIKTLEAQMQPKYTDAMGTLAGRLKRRWLLQGKRLDGEHAEALYKKAYKIATANDNADQSLYLGINVSFMALAFSKDSTAAQRLAKQVLRHCANKPRDQKWALASEAEAHLILGDSDLALQRYEEAAQKKSLKRDDAGRQNLSIYQQASRVASILGIRDVAEKLDGVFGRGEE